MQATTVRCWQALTTLLVLAFLSQPGAAHALVLQAQGASGGPGSVVRSPVHELHGHDALPPVGAEPVDVEDDDDDDDDEAHEGAAPAAAPVEAGTPGVAGFRAPLPPALGLLPPRRPHDLGLSGLPRGPPRR